VATEVMKTPAPAMSQTSMQQAALLTSLRQATIGEYDVIAELGRGGMATVFLAHDIALDRKVAIKVMSPALLSGDGMTERFKREARTAASLSHANIIAIYAVKESDQLIYFVMKFIEGRPLDSIIREVGQLPIPMVQAMSQQVGSALGYAHKRGIVHRDVKPANIMVDSEGWAVVTDFGIAKVSEAHGLTMTGATVGTPAYMSPEQCAAKELTGASDQYSLGVVIYEMLAGRQPFVADSVMALMYAHFNTPPPPIAEARPDVPPELAAAVMRMLEKDPGNRWPNVEAAIAAIGGAPLAPDDPVRTRLMTLAATGAASQLLKRVSTPVSPMPNVRSKVGKTSGVTSLAILPAQVTVALGGAVQLSAKAKGTAGTTVSQGVTWASTNTDIVTVSESGLATSTGVGTATVTATLETTSATATITVRAGRTRRPWLAIVGGAAAVVVAGVVWLLLGSRPQPAPAPPASVATPATAVAPTPAPADTTAPAAATSAPATASPAPPTPVASTVASVDLLPANVDLSIGGSSTLHAAPRDGSGRKLSRAVTWRSSNPRVASVSRAGVVTGQRPGSATITATADGVRSPETDVTITAVAATASAPAVLEMLIEPAWAYVAIDGEPRGQRSRGVDTLRAGIAHRVHFERDGFTSVDTVLTLGPGEHLLRVVMKPKGS
jgi:serine/threonine protein kinase